jgi:superfamily II DNA or RNA helicase
MQTLVDAIRKKSLPGIWSVGVKLAREGAVQQAPGGSDTEQTFRVRSAGHAVAPSVTLYLDDGEWSCDCDAKTDPCAHVVAAALAASQQDKGGESRGAASPVAAHLSYRLGRKGRLLTLERVVVFADGREERLGATLTSGLARGTAPAGLAPTHEDLAIERALGMPAREVIPVGGIPAILDSLTGHADVRLDGAPVKTSGERVVPRAVVDDRPNGGFVVQITGDPTVTEVVALGVGRVGETLHPLGGMEMGEAWERLPFTRAFKITEKTELVTNVIPELEKKFTLEVRTRKLPRKVREARPRIALDLSHQGHTLSVLPTLVYGDPPIARVDGDAVTVLGKEVPVRKLGEERELVLRLRDALNLVPGRRVDFDGVSATRFAQKLRAWQESSGDDDASPFGSRALVPRVVVDGDTFDVVFEIPGDGEDEADGPHRAPPSRARAEAAAVMRAFRDGLDLVPLNDGGWAPLPVDWLAKHGHRVADLLAARDEQKRIRPAVIPELAAFCDDLSLPRPVSFAKLAPLLEGFERIPRAKLPEGLKAELRHYQEVGVDWLSLLRDAELGAILADDMGLGKTLQALAVLRGRALIVCPKSVVYNWVDEIERFRPGLKVAVYHGTRREIDRAADVTLTTYAVLRLDTERLAAESWDAVVLDEAQAIKNEASQTARAVFQLKGRFRLALSGTPVENHLVELWSIMHFANPGLLGGPRDFVDRYSDPISYGGPAGTAAAQRLRAKIRPFVLRRMKREVLPELPPRTDAVLHVELDEAERSVYDAVRVATRKAVTDKLAEGGGGGVLAALEALLRLRQAACHSALVPGQHADSSSKIERLVEALTEAADDGHKALVFSQWTSLLDKVEPHLRDAGIAFTRLDGSTQNRGEVVGRFQSDDGPPVMLVSLKAGGTGLNLTAADHVFLLDPWWNPAVEDQAADRTHRIGQDRPVMVYRLVANGTVEERILALQERKRRLADVALGEADHAGGITREELLALLD